MAREIRMYKYELLELHETHTYKHTHTSACAHTHNDKLDLGFFLLASLINWPVNLKYFTSASQICFMYIHFSAFILFDVF